MASMTKAALKRACFEWLTIGLASATVGQFAFWVASMTTTRTDFGISWDTRSSDTWKEVSTGSGSVFARYRLYGVDEFDYWKGLPGAAEPTASFFSLDFPGGVIRKVNGSGGPRCFVRFSLLMPTLMLAALTVGCYFPYRRARAMWHAELAANRGKLDDAGEAATEPLP